VSYEDDDAGVFDPPIVWGGMQRDPEALYEKMLDNEFMGEPVISVRWDEPRTGADQSAHLERICREGLVKHGKIQTTTRQQVANAGFGFVEDASPGQAPLHYHVVFTSPVTLKQAERFISIFSDPIPNPAKRT
jgi:hypothetical protein